MQNQTRQEQTEKRDLWFSGWLRHKLPESTTGFHVTDIDELLHETTFILRTTLQHEPVTNGLMILEVKQQSAPLPKWQKNILRILHQALQIGCPKLNPPVRFFGCHLINFTKRNFDDGSCYFDGQQVNENQLIELLSF